MNSFDGLKAKLDTKFFIEESNCLDSVAGILPKINPRGLPVLLVWDENTKKVAGDRVREYLDKAGIAHGEMMLSPDTYRIVSPDYSLALKIRDRILKDRVFPVAVGSGTINDLVKRASFEAETPYLCVPTASSVDGYSSFGAALVQDGYKATMQCPPPAAIVADAEVLKTAPYDMTASGYGDLYSKYPAGIDWVLADKLGLEPIHRETWDMIQKDLPSWLGSPEKLKTGDPEAFAALFRGLTMSGFAMQIYKDSRPASGAEHFISHIWEMDHLSRDGLPISHGFKVSVGIVISASLMEAFYSRTADSALVESALKRAETWEARTAAIRKLFPDPGQEATIQAVCRKKWLEGKDLSRRLEKLVSIMPDMKRHLEGRIGSSGKVISDLKKAGCPTSYKEFGLTREDAKKTVMKAQMMRERYVILDSVYEMGLLEELLDEVL